MNLTRERIRQVEVKALAKLEALKDMMALRDYVDEGPVGKRRLPRLTKSDLNGDQFKDVDLEDDDEDDDEHEQDADEQEQDDVEISDLDLIAPFDA